MHEFTTRQTLQIDRRSQGCPARRTSSPPCGTMCTTACKGCSTYCQRLDACQPVQKRRFGALALRRSTAVSRGPLQHRLAGAVSRPHSSPQWCPPDRVPHSPLRLLAPKSPIHSCKLRLPHGLWLNVLALVPPAVAVQLLQPASSVAAAAAHPTSGAAHTCAASPPCAAPTPMVMCQHEFGHVCTRSSSAACLHHRQAIWRSDGLRRCAGDRSQLLRPPSWPQPPSFAQRRPSRRPLRHAAARTARRLPYHPVTSPALQPRYGTVNAMRNSLQK